jgi:hypothetical protein
MATNNRAWTEEETKKAIELFDANYSTAKIASIMNEEGWRKDCPKITRNAVVGLLHRNGCSRDKVVKVITVKDIPVKPKVTVQALVEEKPEPEINPEDLFPRISIVDLLAGECRFPVGELDAEGFHFCSEQIDYTKNTSYCSKHYSLCYYPARRQVNEANNSRRY